MLCVCIQALPHEFLCLIVVFCLERLHRDTWDPFQLNPIGAEKEQKRTCFRILQNLVAVVVALLVLVSGVVSKVNHNCYMTINIYRG